MNAKAATATESAGSDPKLRALYVIVPPGMRDLLDPRHLSPRRS